MEQDLHEAKTELCKLGAGEPVHIRLWPFVTYVCSGGSPQDEEDVRMWQDILAILEAHNEALSAEEGPHHTPANHPKPQWTACSSVAKRTRTMASAPVPCSYGLIPGGDRVTGRQRQLLEFLATEVRGRHALGNMVPGGAKLVRTDLHLAVYETPITGHLQQTIHLLLTTQPDRATFAIRNEVIAHTTRAVLASATEGPVSVETLTFDAEAAVTARRSSSTASRNDALQSSIKETVEGSGLADATGIAIIRGANLFWLLLEYIQHTEPSAQLQWLVAGDRRPPATSGKRRVNNRHRRRSHAVCWPAHVETSVLSLIPVSQKSLLSQQREASVLIVRRPEQTETDRRNAHNTQCLTLALALRWTDTRHTIRSDCVSWRHHRVEDGLEARLGS